MGRVVEVLKKAGVVGRLQNHFNVLKPPTMISDETIIEAIKGCLECELARDKELVNEFHDAIFMDVSEAIKNEMNIEYSNDDITSFFTNSLRRIIDDIEKIVGKETERDGE